MQTAIWTRSCVAVAWTYRRCTGGTRCEVRLAEVRQSRAAGCHAGASSGGSGAQQGKRGLNH